MVRGWEEVKRESRDSANLEKKARMSAIVKCEGMPLILTHWRTLLESMEKSAGGVTQTPLLNANSKYLSGRRKLLAYPVHGVRHAELGGRGAPPPPPPPPPLLLLLLPPPPLLLLFLLLLLLGKAV